MLDGLDDIDWSTLQHAYGSADDVPDHLRALTDPARFDDALEALYGTVFHQGSRYPATPYVVPFAIALISGGVQRARLLRWLTSLVAGHRNPVNPGLWCDGEHLHQWGTTTPVTDPHRDLDHGTTPAILAAIWHHAAQGLSLWLLLLRDDDPAVRDAVAGLLGLLVTLDGVTEALLARLADEPSGAVRGALCAALVAVAPAVVEARLADPSLVCRFTAAVCLPQAEGAAALLLTGLDGIEGCDDALDLAAVALREAPRSDLEAAIPALCQVLQSSAGFSIIPIVQTLLMAAFPQGCHHPLSALQEQVLLALVASPYPWRIGNLWGDLRSHNIPHIRAKAAALIEASVPDDAGLQDVDSGLNYARMGFAEKAIDHFDAVPWVTIFDQHPEGFDALIHYTQMLSAMPDRSARAAELWGEIAARADRPITAMVNRAIVLSRVEGAASAADNLREVTDAFPREPDGWCALGIALRQLERPEEALAATDRAIALQADHRDAWWNRGGLLSQLGRIELALQALERCVAIDPAVVIRLSEDDDLAPLRGLSRFLVLCEGAPA